MAKTSKKSLDMAQLALFTALILLLAFIPGIGYIPLGVTRATIIHVPVIIGSIVLGPKKGAILGGVFGLSSFIMNMITPSVTSFVFSPFYQVGDVGGNPLSLVICFVPRILVGIVPYFVYVGLKKLLAKLKGNDTVSLVIAGICGAMTNTILVMSMIYLFFGDAYARATNIESNALIGAILAIVGVNGVPEAIVAAILTCAVCKVLFKIQKKHN
ncbi:MAG TPA: ECF transporter S component [Clostridiales bacterium]|nr:ECF transporter S component [Clostridiales bacterium]